MPNQEEYNRAVREAASLPAPGPLAEALAREPVQIMGLVLRPISGTDLVTLQLLRSPLVTMITEVFAKPPADRAFPDFDIADALEAAWVLSHPPRTSRALLAKGRQCFRDTVLGEYADNPEFNPLDMTELKTHLVGDLLSAMELWISHRSPQNPGETFFTAPGSPTTASAGSLKPSAP